MELITRRTAVGILVAGTAGLGSTDAQQTGGRAIQSLAGEWRFQADPDNRGLREGWYRQRFSDSLTLPGTLQANGKTALNIEYSVEGLNPKYVPYRGNAWYQREIETPASWAGRRVALFLERTPDSQVWLDGREAGDRQTGRNTPHEHELGESIAPGRHTLTILAGSELPGRTELLVSDRVWARHLKVVPNVARKTARVSAEVANATGGSVKGVIRLEARSFNCARQHEPAAVDLQFDAGPGRQTFESEVAMGDGMLLWDEFQPALYRLTASLRAAGAGVSYADRIETSFGMWEISRLGAKLQFNGRTVFLRGRSAGFDSPITGQPLFDTEDWRRFFRMNKQYGLNHLRAYSFPPDAAFEAADLEGVYVQAELGARSPISPERVQSLVDEAAALLETYGNHPSFCLFTLGNELFGDRAAMAQVVSRLQAQDRRRLFASGSNNFWESQQYEPGDDFWVTWRTRKGSEGDVRASYACANLPAGHIETGPPNTGKDYSKGLEGVPVPVIAHEIGEFQVYPNYDEIAKYTGLMLPRNLEVFRDRLSKAGMLDQWKDFFHASGALAVLCYKEDIETALRTPGFGGFQILDLADCHVQGTALVGILDAFNDSKGLITPDDWRQFCSSTVPLLRFAKYTWSTAETFAADVQVAHHGAVDLRNAVLAWKLKNRAGQAVQSGEMPPTSIPQGNTAKLGSVSFPLKNLKTPARYDLELLIRGTTARNRWPIWVFDPSVDTQPPAGVRIARNLDSAAQQKLADGDTVLLLPDIKDLDPVLEMAGTFVDGQFQSDFWNYSMFQKICQDLEMKPSPGTLGLLIDPHHSALARFPSESHTNWQWWHLIKNSRAVALDGTSVSYRPIVQVIDNVSRNHKLGIVFEFRVGQGRLLVCTADLLKLQDLPEAAQLLRSLLAYAGSAEFQPAAAIDLTTLKSILGIGVVHA
jgi:hypothetical protein